MAVVRSPIYSHAEGLCRPISPAIKVPIPMETARSQSGGGTIASGSFSTAGYLQLISVAASGSATAVNSETRVGVSVDGSSLGSLELFANRSNFKQALTPRRFLTRLTPGAHTVTLTADKVTATGSFDRAAASVIDLGDNPELLRAYAHSYGPYQSWRLTTRGGVVVLWVAASGWTTSPPKMIGASVMVDDGKVADMLLYATIAETHLEFVPVQVVLPELAPGRHTLQILPVSGTSTDNNDRCAVEVLELTAPPQVLAASCPIPNGSCASQSGGQTVASGSLRTSGGTVLLRAMASASSNASSSPLNLTVSVDGRARGSVTGFANSKAVNVPLVSNDILVTELAPGTHTVALTADSNTVTSIGDRCGVSALELAKTMPV